MARDLAIRVIAETQQAEAALGRVERQIEGVGKTATTAAGKGVDLLTQSSDDLAKTMRGLSDQQLDDIIGGLGGMTTKAAEAATATSTLAGAFEFALTASSLIIPVMIALTEALKWYIESTGKAALEAETFAAKQDVINKAIREGAMASISYRDAVDFVNAAEQRRRAQNPAEQAQKYVGHLVELRRKQIDAAAAQDALNRGLADMGIVLGTVDMDKVNKDYEAHQRALEKAAEKQRKLTEAQDRWRASVTSTIRPWTITWTLMKNLEGITEENIGQLTELSSRVLPKFTVGLIDAADGLDVAAMRAAEWRHNLDGLALSFVQLAQVSGDSMGGVTRDIARVVVALNMAVKAGDQWRDATTKSQKASALMGGATSIWSATEGGGAAGVAGGAAAGAAFGTSIMPGWGTAIGAGVGALVGLLRDDGSDDMKRSRRAYIEAAGGLAALNTQLERAAGLWGLSAVETLRAADSVEEYEAAIQNIESLLDQQTAAFETLNETARRYGFTIEELGPAFRRQELDKQAQGLFQDFNVLVAAGIDVRTVLDKMGGSINEFIHLALKTGTEVPAAMQPMLQKMVEMGLLTDQNGNVITDLKNSGIVFAETMSEGFNRVIASVQKLTEIIARGLGVALDNVVTSATHASTAIASIPPPPAYGSYDPGSQYGNPSDAQQGYYHTGGVVLPFVPRAHSGLAVDEVPIVALRGEGVLNRGAMRRIGGAAGLRALNGGGAPAGVVNQVAVYVDGDLHSEAARRRVAETVRGVLDQDVRLRRKMSAR